MSPTMKYVFNMALLHCTDYVRIVEQVRIIITLLMTLDHVHFENEILFTLPTVDRGYLMLLAAHHRCPYLLFTS